MFDLGDKVLDEIIFAMENHDLEFMVTASTGKVVVVGDDEAEADLDSFDESDEFLDPPSWTSADGYALMETFAAGVGDPLARSALQAALSRGRGVFKAFKKTIADYPDAEKRWFEHKRVEMSRRVASWYDDCRVARGLARLGPEPDDRDELLSDDFAFRAAGFEAWPSCVPLLRQGLDEALGSFPEALVEYEFTAIGRDIDEGGKDGLSLSIAEAIGGATVGVAAARKVFVADASFGKLVFLYVTPEYRRMGLGRRLAEHARAALAREGVFRFVVDMPFLPPGFGEALTASGYLQFGARYMSPAD